MAGWRRKEPVIRIGVCKTGGIFTVNFKKLAFMVALCLAVVIGALVFIRDHVVEKTEFIPDITDLTKNYLAQAEISEAAEKRQDPDIKPVEVITTLQDGTHRIALVFDGMPDRPLAARLLDVLAKHKAAAVFFLEGENVADVPEVITLIRQAGQEVGNYTYVGLAGLEKRPVEEQLREICRAQKVITMHDPLAPNLFRAPRTVYTDDLLKSVRAAGLEYAVKENVRFQPGHIHNAAEADAYVRTIAYGSIIAIPVDLPVEVKANDMATREEKPAVDMKPTIREDNSAPVPPQADLAAEVDLLLSAMERRDMQAVFVNQFRKIYYVPAGFPMPQPKSQGGSAK